jgi:anti-sigma factor RsiW
MTAKRPISEDDLHAYVDERLEAGRIAEVDTYLAGHPDMAQRVDGFARQRGMLREALAPIAEEPVPAQLSLSRIIEARRKPATTIWRSIAAAALLLLVGGASGWLGRDALEPPSRGVAALVQEASDNYEVYSPDRARPVEIRASEGTDLVRWVSDRLRRPVVVANLAGSGYRFMGGRVVATPNGAAGMFMYDDDMGSRLVMLMRPMAVERDAPVFREEKGGVTALAWAQGGMGYSVVGAAPLPTLEAIVGEIRKQMAQGA